MLTRPLTSLDVGDLAGFRCTFPPLRSWERSIDELLDRWLVYGLVSGAYEALGTWDDDGQLVAVAVWERTAGTVWRSSLIAVRVGHQRRGLGSALKQALIDHARRSGATGLVSVVHRDNAAAIRMNERLGAECAPDPDDPRHEYLLFFVDLT